MISFELNRHLEIDEEFQGINLTEFAVVLEAEINYDEIVDRFIRSKNFSYDSLRDCVKKEPDIGYLRHAFNFEKISISDFRKLNKEKTRQFLLDFSNEPDWGNDKDEFKTLLNRYLEIHQQFGDDNYFYVLSKDWFSPDDKKLLIPESWCYTYYFIIVSIDRENNVLTIMEWTYD